MKAVLLAAGKGERLGEITQARPKPMILVRGKPILEHNINLCRQHGITEIFVNLHHLPEVIRNYFGDGKKWGVSINYKVESDLLGTAGAVKNFESDFGTDTFLVIYGDNLSRYNLSEIMKGHSQKKADMTVVVFQLENVGGSGVVQMDENQWITAFIEKPTEEPPPSHWVNAGIYVMEPHLLEDIPAGASDFGKDIIPKFIKMGRKILGYKVDEKVIAIDTPGLLDQLSRGE